MAKNIRRMLAMVLVMCMFVSALPMQALAAEREHGFTMTPTFRGEGMSFQSTDNGAGHKEISVSGTNDSGSNVAMTGSSQSETSSVEDSNSGSVIEKTHTYVEMTGKETSGDVEKDVFYQEDATVTKETASDGTVTEQTITDGLETKEWTENEVKPGQEVPSVEVQLKPGETNSNSGAGTYTEETDNVEGGSTETNTDKTTTTTTVDRVVEGTLSDVGVTVNKVTSDLNGSVAPEDYDGKHYDTHEKITGFTQPDGLLNNLVADRYADGELPEGKPEDGGYNYVISGNGDATWAAAPVVMNIVYVRDENGNPIPDGNGGYLIDEEKSTLVYAGSKAGYSGMNSTPGQIVLKDENGNLFYTYCIDKATPTSSGVWYKISNLEDSNYYPDAESEDKLRAIVQNGYWGTEEGTGSLDSVKELLRATYGEEDTVTVTDAQGNEHTYNVVDLIDNLKEHEALACTQAAIWSYSNGSMAAQNGEDGEVIIGVQSSKKFFNGKNQDSPLNQYAPAYNLESDAVMKALYECLLGLEGVSAKEAGATTIIGENHNVKDMALVVNGKVAENGENDVYNVDLQFKLDFDLTEKDSLTVKLTDAAGNPIKDANNNDIVIEKQLGVYDEDAEDNATVLRPDKNGVYTLTGLQLSEGTDVSFNLTLDGTQNINDGVYIYQAYANDKNDDGVETSREASQTLVGLASGTQNVNITVSNTLSFQVEERTHFNEERIWHREFDPVITPPEDPQDPPEVPNFPPFEPNDPPTPYTVEEEPAPAVFRLNNQNEAVEEIPEEPVPLAAPVVTGDNSGMWIAVMLLSVFAMAAINLFDKKRQHEAF